MAAHTNVFRDIDSKSQTAQAEVNHPEWAKAMEVIYPRARDMMAKPRYWHVAYPLAVTALCVAPHEFFLRNWYTCFEAGLGKLKVRYTHARSETISHSYHVGEDLSSSCLEWHAAAAMDVPVSLSRAHIHSLSQTRHYIETCLPTEPGRGDPS